MRKGRVLRVARRSDLDVAVTLTAALVRQAMRVAAHTVAPAFGSIFDRPVAAGGALECELILEPLFITGILRDDEADLALGSDDER